MSNNVALVRRFIQEGVQADTGFAEYFTEDAVWWNAPTPPVTGRDAIRTVFRREAQRMKPLHWDIRHIVGEGRIVLTERVDHFLAANKEITIPVMGIFELRDGKIAAWRDYWDLQQFQRQFPVQTTGSTEPVETTKPQG